MSVLIIAESLFCHIPIGRQQIILFEAVNCISFFIDTFVSKDVCQLVVCSQNRVSSHCQHRTDDFCPTHTRSNDACQFCAISFIFEELDVLIYNSALQLHRNVTLRSIERGYVGTELHALHLEVNKPVACRFRFRLLTVYKESSFRLFASLNAILQREGIMVKSEYFHSLYIHACNQFFHCTILIIPEDVAVFVELLAEHILYLYFVVICHDYSFILYCCLGWFGVPGYIITISLSFSILGMILFRKYA